MGWKRTSVDGHDILPVNAPDYLFRGPVYRIAVYIFYSRGPATGCYTLHAGEHAVEFVVVVLWLGREHICLEIGRITSQKFNVDFVVSSVR